MLMECPWGCSVMASKSQETVTDNTKNIAIDRRAVQESGTQIIDSIVVDQSAESVRDVIKGLTANWQTATKANSLNLVEIMDLGQTVLKLADKSQITLEGVAYQTLKNGLDQFDGMMRQGQLSIELVDNLASKSIDATTDISEAALDILAEVKTGDFGDNLRAITFAVMAFSLIAIYMTRKE